MHICLFDIDGTLLSSGGAGKAAMEASLAEEFVVTLESQSVPYSGRTDRAIGRDLLALHRLEPSEANWQRLCSGYLRRLPDYLARYRGKVLPGIASLLQTLARRSDVAVGLLTGNVRHGARLKLGHYGLYEHFAFGGFGDHHFDRNDVAREAIEVARGHLRRPVDPACCWVIGDTPLDISCARCIGVRVAAVATGWHSVDELAAAEPDLLLTDLSDPTPLLSCWH